MAENPLAEKARALARKESVGVLCTMAKRHAGYPFGSVVQYALDGALNPLFLISGMAQHTQNLIADNRASLVVAENVPPGEAVVAARLTLLGDVEPAQANEVGESFLTRHPDAAQWAGFGDFAYYRLKVKAAYYVGGFGVMGWVRVDDFLA